MTIHIGKTYYHILPPEQKSLWPSLHKLSELGFVLYGGTAIALQCGHRNSVDFDFFSSLPYTKEEIYTALPFLRGQEVLQDSERTLTVAYKKDKNTLPVKLSFFSGIRFGRIGEPVMSEDNNLWLASKEDLLSLKLATIVKRVATKDYMDVAQLVRDGLSLEKGILGAMRLYGDSFIPAISLTSLLYFKDLNPPLSLKDQKELVSAIRKLPEQDFVKHKIPEKQAYWLESDDVFINLDTKKIKEYCFTFFTPESKSLSESLLKKVRTISTSNVDRLEAALFINLLRKQGLLQHGKQKTTEIER